MNSFFLVLTLVMIFRELGKTNGLKSPRALKYMNMSNDSTTLVLASPLRKPPQVSKPTL